MCPSVFSFPTLPVLARRLAWGAVFAALVAAVVAVPGHGVPWWVVLAVGLAPDLPLLAGITPGLAQGQLAPRAVPAYNAVHRAWAPLPLLALAAAGVVDRGWIAAALAWGAHIAWDRALGYRLRARDGFQRG
jgi:hypothetical protein